MKNNIVIDSELSIHPVDGFDYFTQSSVGTKYLIAKLDGTTQDLQETIPEEQLGKWALAENEQLFIAFVKSDGSYKTDPILMSYSPQEGFYYLPLPNEVIHQAGEWRIVACKKLNWDENTGIADAVMFGKNDFTFTIANSIPNFDGEYTTPITDQDLVNAVETMKNCLDAAEEIAPEIEQAKSDAVGAAKAALDSANDAANSALEAEASRDAARLSELNAEKAKNAIKTIKFGTAQTLPAGVEAYVKNIGSDTEPLLILGLPMGKAATVEVDSVETLPAGQMATVENIGTAENARFKIKIPKGEGFSITKTYSSIDAMNKDFYNDNIPLNAFVLIDTGDVNDEENARVYIKREDKFEFLIDLSGAQGIRGEVGPAGNAATIEDVFITMVNSNETPRASNSGTKAAAILNLAIPQSPPGPQGLSGIMAVTNGLFSLWVDEATGNLFCDYSDGVTEPPGFEFDENTGELYLVTSDEYKEINRITVEWKDGEQTKTILHSTPLKVLKDLLIVKAYFGVNSVRVLSSEEYDFIGELIPNTVSELEIRYNGTDASENLETATLMIVVDELILVKIVARFSGISGTDYTVYETGSKAETQKALDDLKAKLNATFNEDGSANENGKLQVIPYYSKSGKLLGAKAGSALHFDWYILDINPSMDSDCLIVGNNEIRVSFCGFTSSFSINVLQKNN